MKKVFLDCGAHWGESSRDWSRKHPEYDIIMFEPNPNIDVDIPEGGRLYKTAVWTHDCKKKFYFDGKKGEGNSLLKHKNNVLWKDPAIVECIDFDRWTVINLEPTDYIVLKMDIEGAEYPVLKKMMDNGSIYYINRLYIEFHWKKIGMSKEEHKKYRNRLKGFSNLELRKEFTKYR